MRWPAARDSSLSPLQALERALDLILVHPEASEVLSLELEWR